VILLESFDSFRAKVMNVLLVRIAKIMGLVELLASQECAQHHTYVNTHKVISYINSYVDTRKAISHIYSQPYILACVSATTKFQFHQTTPIKSAIKSIPTYIKLSLFKALASREAL
jgi:hypothetical protein